MPNVLVTGAGRGIGRAITKRLAATGWDVYAGVRKSEDGASLVAEFGEHVHPVQLDVTSASDIAALDEVLPERLDAVVNNAGFAQGGPVEAVPIDDIRNQFDVNVFGQIAVSQALLPKLRLSRGRIVFVSSVSGRISTPMTGVYNASKFALEGIADAMRLELAPWRIRVSLVEPAQTDTSIWQDAEGTLEAETARLAPEHRELYARHVDGFRKIIKMSQRMALSPDGVAAAVERALSSRRPRARYVVGAGPKLQVRMAGLTPTPVRDAMFRRVFGIAHKA
jgi:NAD(P)-dependent dehydrogenase (short-subunit alcohol dehydrogenase family)